jgi:dTDP-4-amino-4,6-dideoxygalactose transaminase
MINVTKTYLPPFEEYAAVLKRAWDSNWITNNGELLRELEIKLKDYLGVEHLLFCANGTIVLQMALKVLKITKEVITTPFSYVATANAILWEGCTPVFVDIRPDTFCIDANKIEAAITENTEAILATHVYGFPCNVEDIQKIAEKYNLKVIYDGAHCFGCRYKGKSLLSFGDIGTCSFHATKIFHTVEGGAIICNDENLYRQLLLFRQFGHEADEYFSIGINGKNSEFHAAMGLCVLPKLNDIICRRKTLTKLYSDTLRRDKIEIRFPDFAFEFNYGYYPILFESESVLLKVRELLLQKNISTRRYFFPSLNELPFIHYQSCKISESVSRRVLSLPLYYGLCEDEVIHISEIINSAV